MNQDAFTTVSALPALPARPDDAHKGTFGSVLVLGGCATMIGAPALAASGALRGGAGLVKIATDPAVLPFAITIQPGATGIALPDDPEGIIAALDAADPGHRAVLAVGPGLGRRPAAPRLVERLVRGPRRLVLDADGLNALADGRPRRHQPEPPLVLTPHPGEFRRLAEAAGITHDPLDPAQRPLAAAAMATVHHAVVVLKGRHSIVSDGPDVYVNRTGNPALATAGTGDVLTGLIAALLAQGMATFDAAVLGTHLHGAAADLWLDRHGPSGLTARDLAALLPDACRAHRDAAAQASRPDH